MPPDLSCFVVHDSPENVVLRSIVNDPLSVSCSSSGRNEDGYNRIESLEYHYTIVYCSLPDS
jgi:hypothetical protein